MLKSVIVGLDATSAGDQAQEFALALARRHGAKITGVSVIDVPYLTAPEAEPIGGADYKFMKDAALLERAKKDSDELLGKFAERCRAVGIEHDAATYRGDPCAEILGAVDAHDLIIVGRDTTFHRDHDEVVGGAVERLLKGNPRPLIITPPTASDGASILLAYDGSLPSMRAVQIFALLRLAADNPIQVLAIREDRSTAQALAERGKAYLAMHGIKADAHGVASQADPAEVLLAEMQGLGAGLVVMGAYGHRGWREAILGSCTRTLLRRSTAPLFVHH